ncbi:MAG: endonuclease [Gammaproteobacteria bacterium HGW-Gammaproteobacteria-2]|jgi:endonuclease/exonuclease/phosphatase family metal-dependent hydrolase|nr:MAG: endonuclease [Gammaproteobacteria bacterium HGW-Gammaproteobacteria-2]
MTRILLLALTGLVLSCSQASVDMPTAVRFATFNTSLYADSDGGLIARLMNNDAAARKVAAIIQHQRPDVLLLNEFDYDDEGKAIAIFLRDYLAVGQLGEQPISYPHHFSGTVNTGVASGLDLDGDGRSDGPGDAWGFGRHPGQYGMLVLSRYPIDANSARSFQHFRWADLPDALTPKNPDTGAAFYPDTVWQQLRLSSKSHWDVPIHSPLGVIHFLVSHPTPPVFDGPENRNGLRNHDEIRFWAEYLSDARLDWLYDDDGKHGGLLQDAAFVIAGDLNADPMDGDGFQHPVRLLLDHPRVNSRFVPTSSGARAQAARYGHSREGNTATHTGDFGPSAGTLRIDYVLPSRQLNVRDGGVFWPATGETGHDWIDASDHHLVWLDLTINRNSTTE